MLLPGYSCSLAQSAFHDITFVPHTAQGPLPGLPTGTPSTDKHHTGTPTPRSLQVTALASYSPGAHLVTHIVRSAAMQQREVRTYEVRQKPSQPHFSNSRVCHCDHKEVVNPCATPYTMSGTKTPPATGTAPNGDVILPPPCHTVPP